MPDLPPTTASKRAFAWGNGVCGVMCWVAKVLSVAVGYYFFGRIGLLLEVEPQHTCAVWPAAGFALGALIVFGWRVWPGVLIGALCVNPTSCFDPEGALSTQQLALTESVIAIGCTLHGLVGLSLLKRFVGIPAPLLEKGVILKFLLVGGPLAGTVSSAIGTATLFAAGLITHDELLFTWCTWWVGDALGVAFVTPIFLIAFGEPRAAWRPRVATVGVPIVLAFAIAAASFVFARNDAARVAAQRLEERAQDIGIALDENATRASETMHSIARLYGASDTVTRAEFHSFGGGVRKEQPTFLTLAWCSLVPRDDRAQFVARMRSEGCASFEIIDASGTPVAAVTDARTEHVVVTYLESNATTSTHEGLDLASVASYREALAKARDSGTLTATPALPIASTALAALPSWMCMPIYRNDAPVATVEERRANLVGFITATLSLEGLIARETQRRDGVPYAICLQDTTDGVCGATVCSDANGVTLHREGESMRNASAPRAGEKFEFEFEFAFADRRVCGWLTEMKGPQAIAAAWYLWGVNIAGLALVAMLCGTVLSLTGAHIRFESTVAERASEVETSRASAEAALREVESLCAALNEHALISIADARGRIIEVNEQFCLLSGYTRDELIGCDHRVINSGCHPRQFWVEVWRTLASGHSWRGEVCNRAKNGELYWVESIIAPFKGRDGKIQRFTSIRTDVTARKKGELALASMNALCEAKNTELAAMAERAHRVVDDVSHEFRTPLAVIKEFASIITDGLAGPVSVKQAEYLRIMDGAVIDLNHMVEDLLDSSKLRVGRLRVDRRSHTVEEIVAVGRAALLRKASVRSIVIEEQIEPGLPCVFADEEKVRRVISNFMTNAIKFTPDGGKIELSAHRSTRSEEIVISVTDHGPGLTQADMDCLFGRFRQFSTARAVAAKGFGLGLSIAQELAWLSLGRISVESERGKATTFSVALPTNDPESLLTHYFETIAATDRAHDELALLKISVLDSRHRTMGTNLQQDPFEIDAFLASITYAADSVIPVPDERAGVELDSGARAWLIVGRTRSPNAWMERIRNARAIAIAESDFRLGMLRVDLEASWAFPAEAATAHARLISMVTKGLVPVEL